jgi:hypothetical protein
MKIVKWMKIILKWGLKSPLPYRKARKIEGLEDGGV